MKIGNPQNMRGTPLLTSAVTSGGILSGAGTSESPIVFNGIPALDSAGSPVMSGAKALKAGGGVSFSAGESGALVISASGGGGTADVLVNSVDSSVSDKAPVASAVYAFVDSNYAKMSGGKIAASALPLATGGSAGAVVIGAGLSASDGVVSVVVDSAVGNTSRPVANSAVSAALAGKADSSVLSAHAASSAMHLPSGGVAGQHLVYGATGAEWADQQETGGSVTVETTLVDGANPVAGSAIVAALSSKMDSPSLTGNAGKALVVNSGATGFEFRELSSGATVTVDGDITSDGANPVAGSAIHSALNNKQAKITNLNPLSYSLLTDVPGSFTPSTHTHSAAEVTDFGAAVSAAVSSAVSGKMDIPDSGVSGQVLTKTASGYEWASMQGGTDGMVARAVDDSDAGAIVSSGADGDVFVYAGATTSNYSQGHIYRLSGGGAMTLTLVDINDDEIIDMSCAITLTSYTTLISLVAGDWITNSTGGVWYHLDNQYYPWLGKYYDDEDGWMWGIFSPEIEQVVAGNSLNVQAPDYYAHSTEGETALPASINGWSRPGLGSYNSVLSGNSSLSASDITPSGSVTVDSAVTSDGANPVAGSAIYAAISSKMDLPDSGASGQVLTKTASGYEWAAVQAGVSGDFVLNAESDSGMEALLTSANTGKSVLFSGDTTSSYTQGHIYKVSGGNSLVMRGQYMGDNDDMYDWAEYSGTVEEYPGYTALLNINYGGIEFVSSTGGQWYRLDNGNSYYFIAHIIGIDMDDLWVMLNSEDAAKWNAGNVNSDDYLFVNSESASSLNNISYFDNYSAGGHGMLYVSWTQQTGYAAMDITPAGGAVTVDSSITQNSTNPVQGGAIYTALAGKINTPATGSTGQVLKKTSNGVEWGNAITADSISNIAVVSAMPANPDANTLYLVLDNSGSSNVTVADVLDIIYSNSQVVDQARSATISGSTLTTDTADGTVGIVFDRTNDDYLSVPSQSSDLSGDFTIEAWVKPNSADLQYSMAIMSGEGDCKFGLNIMSGYWSMWAGTGSSWDLLQADSSSVFDGVESGKSETSATSSWQHVAFVHSGTTFTLYVDGTAILSRTVVGNVVLGNAAINIGRWGASGDRMQFGGLMAQIRIWNSARYTAAFTPPSRT